MMLTLLGAGASLAVFLLSVTVIGHMIASHWRQIAMALNAEIILNPDPLPPETLRIQRASRPSAVARPWPELRAAA